MTFDQRYGPDQFDPIDRHDQIADKACLMVLETFCGRMEEFDINTGKDVEALLVGLVTGQLSVLYAMMPATDENHFKIRTSVQQILPWAMDFVRDMEGLPPLPRAS